MTTTQTQATIATDHCRTCHQKIIRDAVLDSPWQDPDGCVNCAGSPEVYAPHQPVGECAEVEQPVCWAEVREGDLVRYQSQWDRVEKVMPPRPSQRSAGHTRLMIAGSWLAPRREHTTAVRRYVEG